MGVAIVFIRMTIVIIINRDVDSRDVIINNRELYDHYQSSNTHYEYRETPHHNRRLLYGDPYMNQNKLLSKINELL